MPALRRGCHHQKYRLLLTKADYPAAFSPSIAAGLHLHDFNRSICEIVFLDNLFRSLDARKINSQAIAAGRTQEPGNGN